MTNFDEAWGEAKNSWRTISIQDQYVSQAWAIVAWAGMIAAFVFGIALLLTRSDWAYLLMGMSLAVWITGGIIVIRTKRKERKVITLEHD